MEKLIWKKSSSECAVFNKFKDYRTWSFFHVILFNRSEDEVVNNSSFERQSSVTRHEQFYGKLDWVTVGPLTHKDREKTPFTKDENLRWIKQEVLKYHEATKKDKKGHTGRKANGYDFRRVDNPVAASKETVFTELDSDMPSPPPERLKRGESFADKVKESIPFGHHEDESYKEFKNWDVDKFITKKPLNRFRKEIINVLLFRGMLRELVHLRPTQYMLKGPVIVWNSIVLWIVYSITLVFFPLMIIVVWSYLTMHCLGKNFIVMHLNNGTYGFNLEDVGM